MGYQELADSIRARGRADEERIRREAQTTLADWRKEREEAAAAECDTIERDAAQRARLQKQKLVTQASLAAKRRVNQTKQELLDETFQKAKDAVESLPDADKARLFQRLVSEGYAAGGRTLTVDPAHRKLLDEKALKKAHPDLTVETKPIGFGLLFADDQGVATIDYRLPALIEAASQAVRADVAKTLFGTEMQ